MSSDPSRQKSERLSAGDVVGLERENGEWMKGIVVQAELEGIDVVVDGGLLKGEVLSVSRTVQNEGRYTAVMEVVSAGAGRSRVRLMGDWKRVQMRQSVRVSVFGVRVAVHGQREPALPDEDSRAPRLLDLSAGGLCFESSKSYATGEVVDLDFTLPHGVPVSVRGEIIRVAGRRNADKGPNLYGIRFCGVGEAVRVKIMTWVFEEQARRFRESSKPDSGTAA